MVKPESDRKKFHLTYDIIISAIGILLVVFLVLTFVHPENAVFRMAAFTAGGLVNVFNGMKILKDKVKRNIGLSYIFFGIIIIFIGIFLMQY